MFPNRRIRRRSAGVAQLVERQPSKLNVGSSSLLARFSRNPATWLGFRVLAREDTRCDTEPLFDSVHKCVHTILVSISCTVTVSNFGIPVSGEKETVDSLSPKPCQILHLRDNPDRLRAVTLTPHFNTRAKNGSVWNCSCIFCNLLSSVSDSLPTIQNAYEEEMDQ